jgi:hypothetical protein
MEVVSGLFGDDSHQVPGSPFRRVGPFAGTAWLQAFSSAASATDTPLWKVQSSIWNVHFSSAYCAFILGLHSSDVVSATSEVTKGSRPSIVTTVLVMSDRYAPNNKRSRTMKKPNPLLEDLKSLLPTIAANAFQAEEDRQVPAENIA